jgi:hypothetical protein
VIKNPDLFQEWEDRWSAAQRPDHIKSRRLLEGLYKEARHLKVWARADPLEGLDTLIQLARDLNRV